MAILTRPMILIWLLLLFFPTRVESADRDGAFALKGIARLNCAQYVENRKQKTSRYFQFGGWIEGYITAYNQLTPETFDLLSFETTELLALMIAQHCAQNPEDRVADVVVAMVRKLKDYKVPVRSALIVVPGTGGDLAIYVETMRRAQQALKDKGYYQSTIDGKYGPNTKSAFQAFQRDNNLAVTDRPDQQTLHLLLH